MFEKVFFTSLFLFLSFSLAASVLATYLYPTPPILFTFASHVPLLFFPLSTLLRRLYSPRDEPLLSSQSLLATSRILDRASELWVRMREKEREKGTSSGRGGCQEAVVRTRSEIETLPACARERVYMESSLRRTRTEIAPLAGRVARTRFRLLQYLSCCKFDVSLIIRGQKGDEGIEEATKEEERENEVAKCGRERREGEG